MGKFIFCVTTSLISTALLISCNKNEVESNSPKSKISEVPQFIPKVKYGLLINNLFSESYSVSRNQQFIDLLQDHAIGSKALQQLNSLSRKEFDFRKVRTGQQYTLFLNPDSICSVNALAYELNSVDYVIFHFGDSLRLEHCSKEINIEEKEINGIIKSTLSESISSQGISHELTNKLVDIMGWQIDFHQLFKGDSFKIVYKQKVVDDKSVGIEAIDGIYFDHASRDYWAIPFDQGEGLDYFDLSGKSIRRAFLKYPIEFTRISSRYSLNRFHPVLKVNRPHLGTDLSAATGTPIRAVGDGTVIDVGYNGGSGNYVKIKHNGTYTTGYLHMSRFGSGIRKGTHVSQGQVIGYVGSTGWATGPHLCYRFWKDGVQVDALRVAIPPAKPVRNEVVENFTCTVELTVTKLRSKIDQDLNEKEVL